jgi:hypothetical protein
LLAAFSCGFIEIDLLIPLKILKKIGERRLNSPRSPI